MFDPLSISIPLAGVDTTYPLIPSADYPFQIVESKVVPNKRQDGHNWEITLATTAPITAVDNRVVNPDARFGFWVALQPGPDAKDPQGFLKGISSAIDAIFGTSIDNRPTFNKELWESATGKTVIGHVTVEVDQRPGSDGKQSNKIARLKPVK